MENDDWLVNIIIGGVLVILGFFVVPILLIWGYGVEVMRGAVEGSTEPDGFDDWGELAVDGLQALIIVAAYQIVPAVVFGVLFVLSGALLASGSEAGAGLGLLGFLLSYGVWMVLAFVAGYVSMVGVVNFAVEGSIGAGFDFGVVRTVATSMDYLMAWVFYVAISIVVGIVSMVGITAPFASFYGLTSTSRAFGEAYASATK